MPASMMFWRELLLPCDLLFWALPDKEQSMTNHMMDVVDQLHDIHHTPINI
jgi:hypothetical protein